MNALKRQFIELAKESGWSQAEIARRLDISRGGVNGIITGATEPSKALVRLFQFVLQSENTHPSKPAAPSLREALPPADLRKETTGEYWELYELLQEMSGPERADFLAHVKSLAQMMVKKAKKGKKATKY